MSKKILRLLVIFIFLACNVSSVPLSSVLLNKISANLQLESKPEPEPFIIHGDVAKPSIAPYIVSLSISKLTYAHACAGCIISKQWVLTAAHCLKEIANGNGGSGNYTLGYPIYAGLNDRNKYEEAQVRYVDFEFLHKHFNGVEGSEDIALLHVSEPFEFNDKVRSIALPELREDFAGQESTTYGWGLVEQDASKYSKELRVASAKVIPEKECRKIMPAKAPISPRTICARVKSCFGDGGSPLVIERNGYPMELIGLGSWAFIPCGYENRPTAFIAISHYVDWINQVQWAHSILHGGK